MKMRTAEPKETDYLDAPEARKHDEKPNQKKHLHSAFLEMLRQSSTRTRDFMNRRFYGCNESPSKLSGLLFPLFPILSHYRWRWVINDIIAGVIVAMIHLPQAMAGAMTAVMKPHHGLYMTIFPAFIYAFLSSSPQNHIGGMPISAALVGVSTARIRQSYHSDNSTMQTADEIFNLHFRIAGAVAFVAGIIQISMGFLKLGFLSNILSSNVLDPFSVACCLQAICGQIPIMFGMKLYPYTGLFKHPWLVVTMFINISNVNGADALISSIAGSIIIGFREFLQPTVFRKLKMIVPIEFVVLVAAIVVSYIFNFEERFDVRVLGPVSQEIPLPTPPPSEYLPFVLTEGLINAIVSFGLTLSSAKVLARKDGDRISPNQELIAIGCANLIGSFFSCFVSAAPVGRSIINQSMGSKSQLSSIFGCILMAGLLFTVGGFLQFLPICIVSTNIVVTLIMTVKIFGDLPEIWKRSRLDAVIWSLTFICCILLDVRIGLLVGLGFSLFSIVYRSQRPKIRVIGHIPNSAGFLPLKYYQEALEIPGLRILQMQSALHYGNAEYLVKKAKYMILERHSTPVSFPKSILNLDGVQMSIKRRHRRVSLPACIIGSPVMTPSLPCLIAKIISKAPSTEESELFLNIPEEGSLTSRSETNPDNIFNKTLAGSCNTSERTRSAVNLNYLPHSKGQEEELQMLPASQEDILCRVILDLSMVSFIDSVGFRALEQLANDLEKLNIELFISQNKGSVIQHIKRLNILKTIPEENIFLCLEDAVIEAVRRNILLTHPSSRLHLQEKPDQRFYPAPAFRVEGLPGTN